MTFALVPLCEGVERPAVAAVVIIPFGRPIRRPIVWAGGTTFVFALCGRRGRFVIGVHWLHLLNS